MNRYTPAFLGRERKHLIAAKFGSVVLYDDHLAAVQAAVAEEREACAKIAETVGGLVRKSDASLEHVARIAAAIRKRGQP